MRIGAGQVEPDHAKIAFRQSDRHAPFIARCNFRQLLEIDLAWQHEHRPRPRTRPGRAHSRDQVVERRLHARRVCPTIDTRHGRLEMEAVRGHSASRHALGHVLGSPAIDRGFHRIVQSELETPADRFPERRTDVDPSARGHDKVHPVTQASGRDFLDRRLQLLEVLPQRRPVVDDEEDVVPSVAVQVAARAHGAQCLW